VPASVARTGVQVYTDANGREVREYRPPEEVFAADSQASLAGIPVTIGHPGAVDSTNWRKHAVGHVSDAPPNRRPEGATEWLEASVYVADGQALERVERGDLVEVSMGYTADVIAESGVSPAGERYDAVQRNIRFNHLALLQDGRARAGRGARLRLDGNQETIPMIQVDQTFAVGARVEVTGVPHMPGADGPGTVEIVDGNAYGIRFDKMPNEIHKWYVAAELRPATSKMRPMAHKQDSKDGADVRRIKVDGIDCDYGSETHVQMLERRADALEAKAKAAEAELGAVKAKLDAVPAQPDVSKLIADELAFRDGMRPLLGTGYQFEGKSRLQVRLDAVGADVAAKVQALPEGQREGYLQCAIDAKVAAADKPTHAPTVVVKKDSSEPVKFDPYAKLKAAHAASYNNGAAK
jgi:hypothetical protein